jgi:hypothetical protein
MGAFVATDEIIATWKAKYGKVVEVKVKDGDKNYVGYFRRPDMETLSAVNKLYKTDEVKSANVLFDNCWLGGDEQMKADAIVKMSAIAKLQELTQICVAEIKNL